MIEILVYLFETYGYADACPEEPEQLSRKLAAAGFEESEISDAIAWLADLRRVADLQTPTQVADSRSVRIFTEEEQRRLDSACRGFLAFLENAAVLDAAQRELVIERAMALPDGEVSLSKFKVIVLMVLWQQQASVDTLILDELLTEETDEDEGWDDAITVH